MVLNKCCFGSLILYLYKRFGEILRLKALILEGYYSKHKATINKYKAIWKINAFRIFQLLFFQFKSQFSKVLQDAHSQTLNKVLK